jgi:hypothetical protein
VRAGGGYRGSDGFVLPHALERANPATYARLTADGDLRLNTDVKAFDGFLSLRRVSESGAWASFTGTGNRVERGVAPEAHTSDPRLWRYPFQLRGLGALSGGTGMREMPGAATWKRASERTWAAPRSTSTTGSTTAP